MSALIYVELLEEGSRCWRPVSATARYDGTYSILGIVPSGEVWAFQPGERVRCEEHTFANGEMGLVARIRL